MAAWEDVRAALAGGKSINHVEDKVDLLGSLRPTRAGADQLHEMMRIMLEYTCSMQTENKDLQRRMAAIAMRQMRESGAQGSIPVFKDLADNGDPEIRAIAFRNLVVCHEEGCKAQAEACILHELECGNQEAAEERLKCFVKSHALSRKLVDAFSGSEDPEVLAILSGPTDEEGLDRAVEQLSNADSCIRRNAAMSLIRHVSAGDREIVGSLDRALGRERDRDTRLVMLIARGTCHGDADSFPSKKCHLPKTVLEMAICKAVAGGVIPYVPPVAVEPAVLNTTELDPEAVVPGAYT